MARTERRRSRRKQTDNVIEFYDTDGTLLVGIGRVINHSTVGALVESTIRLDPGQRLWARLRRSGRSHVERSIKVIRARRKGAVLIYGLEFTRA